MAKKLGCAKCGGQKMETGGSIIGGPLYGNNPRTQQGRMLKTGGSSTAVKERCPPGTARLANGGCGDRPLYGG
jgi:hypothetical protein